MLSECDTWYNDCDQYSWSHDIDVQEVKSLLKVQSWELKNVAGSWKKLMIFLFKTCIKNVSPEQRKLPFVGPVGSFE